MTVAIIVAIAFYFLLFILGYVFGRMDKKSNEVPMKPLEVKYTRHDLKHWTACKLVDPDQYNNFDPSVMETIVAEDLACKFADVIKEHMITEKDYEKRMVKYRIDIWLDGGN